MLMEGPHCCRCDLPSCARWGDLSVFGKCRHSRLESAGGLLVAKRLMSALRPLRTFGRSRPDFACLPAMGLSGGLPLGIVVASNCTPTPPAMATRPGAPRECLSGWGKPGDAPPSLKMASNSDGSSVGRRYPTCRVSFGRCPACLVSPLAGDHLSQCREFVEAARRC
jgi:hypothetical protein